MTTLTKTDKKAFIIDVGDFLHNSGLTMAKAGRLSGVHGSCISRWLSHNADTHHLPNSKTIEKFRAFMDRFYGDFKEADVAVEKMEQTQIPGCDPEQKMTPFEAAALRELRAILSSLTALRVEIVNSFRSRL